MTAYNGDFNDIISMNKKDGGKSFNPRKSYLKDLLDNYGGMDLGDINSQGKKAKAISLE